ncbi:MAG: molybdenum cofactor biosynthesis protein MoaE [Anaerolineae bacterium]|nr:molybdenum cofactor biosynthesis protein MoaE [Anaerolineae bacterium]
MLKRKLFEITTEPISADEVQARVAARSVGAITSFTGVVRERGGEREVEFLEYEAYPEMAEAMLAQIGDEIRARWPQIEAVSIVHRTGRLAVGEVSVVIAVAAAHRADTFDACRYAIDRLKAIVPIWKKEIGPGGEVWIENPKLKIQSSKSKTVHERHETSRKA